MGLLLVKELIVIDKGAGVRAGEVRMRGLPYLQASILGCLAEACSSLQKCPVLQTTDSHLGCLLQANTSLYELLHLFESGRCHM